MEGQAPASFIIMRTLNNFSNLDCLVSCMPGDKEETAVATMSSSYVWMLYFHFYGLETNKWRKVSCY